MSQQPPRKLTERTQEKFLTAMAVGADVALACKTIGVSVAAIYKLRDRSPDFKAQMDEARAIADQRVVRSLYEAATKLKNVTAMIFWLKNRQPNEWRDRHDYELSGGSVGITFRFPGSGGEVPAAASGLPAADFGKLRE
jgi:hypothetical protein